ncbi:NAD(P)-dependent oxidoreductase [Micromonospora sp. NPDC049559]|uniref:NAD(P)-dependent oxidoreductase n=1 Tax=Micromonospora sp. NPDC049559 TaxID=3155923 RepID=UPI00343A9099
MANEERPVAVLGLGGMGHGMAASALRAGIPTVVWNRSPRRTADLAEAGARVADSVADAAGRADIAVTMVTDADAVRSLAVDQGMLAALPDGAIWAQMSTIGVAATEQLAALVRERRPDVTFLDAPVAGSRAPAEAGKLLVLASGPDEARPRVAPLFDAVGQRTLWLGPAGTGSRMKLVNNILLAFLAEGLGEAVALGRELGLEASAVAEAFGGGPLASPWISGKLQRMAKGDYSPEFPLALAFKDVRLAMDEIDPDRFVVGACLASQWRRAMDRGFGDQDVTAVARAIES